MTGAATDHAAAVVDGRTEGVLAEVRKTWAAGRLAHAYLISGPPRGAAAHLAEQMVQLVMCAASAPPCRECTPCRQAAAGRHPDVHWIEPLSKSRQILADQIRRLNRVVATTSFAGGWKAGIIRYADRMNDTAANIFLKTLEEPPPRTLLLLLSDTGQMLLPTIRSRCQHLSVGIGACVPDEEWVDGVRAVLRAGAPPTALDAMTCAAQLAAVLKQVKADVKAETDAGQDPNDDDTEDEVLAARIEARVKEFQESFLRVLQFWYRDVLLCAAGGAEGGLMFPAERAIIEEQARILGRNGAMSALDAVEQCTRRLADNFAPSAAFEALFRQVGRAGISP